MMFLGSLLGFFIIPFIADNFGTRLALRIAWGTGTVSVLLACLAPNPYILALALFLVGFGANPSITLCFSIINETCLGRSRQRFAVGIQIAWAVGEIVIALVFLSSISWKGVMYVIFALFVGGSLAV
jgi:MFS family permease